MLQYVVMFTRALSKRNRVLLKELVKTDFKLRYQGSVLGVVWSVLKPLLLFTVMYLVFVRFLRMGVDAQGHPIPHFAVSLLLAITLWSFFTEATAQGMQAIVARGDLLRKIKFPHSIVVVSATVSALINLSISFVVLLVFAIINGVDFHWHILFVLLIFIELYVLAIGLAFLLSALYVKFRDISPIWDVLLQAAFYATPIIYPLSMIAQHSILLSKVFLMNPIAQIIQDARYLVVYTGTDTVWNYLGNVLYAFIPIVLVLVVAALGIWYFDRNSKHFTEMV
jgi:ABC-2 type transport system permease protein